MSMLDCRARFEKGTITKPDYIEEMYKLHSRLFEYAKLIKQTDISAIEIQDDHLIMTLRNSGIKLLCESLDKRAAPIEILNFDSYEKTDANMILELVDSNMVFFDIGANIGWYSMNVAKHDAAIQIHAFEPIPDTYRILSKNIELNKINNVHLYNIGFSDNNQELTFYFDPLQSGNASARNLADLAGIQKVVSKTEKLDDFFPASGLKQLDFIKCDVEGAELLVYQGGLETLTQFKPIIFTEMLRKWSQKFGYHPNEIIQLFSELGYRCFTAKDGKLIEFYKMDENTLETNFFFLHAAKHAAKIQQLGVA
jgi:FkbM family methyltransferase